MFEAVIKQVEPMTVAFVTMRGPYAQIPQALGTLYGWVARHGLVPVGMPAAVYFTSPADTPMAEAEWEVWAPVAGEPAALGPDENGLGVKHVGPATVASTIHFGPYEAVESAYRALEAWVVEHGYAMAGPPRELYLNDPHAVAPEQIQTEIQFPVAKR